MNCKFLLLVFFTILMLIFSGCTTDCPVNSEEKMVPVLTSTEEPPEAVPLWIYDLYDNDQPHFFPSMSSTEVALCSGAGIL